MKYLIVCTGNTCRSPMAAELLRRELGENGKVKSAGVAATQGAPATQNTVNALRELGIALRHSSQPVSRALVNWADIILGMEPYHVEHTVALFPESTGKAMTLGAWAGAPEVEIPDPFGGAIEDYRRTRDAILSLVKKGLGRQQ